MRSHDESADTQHRDTRFVYSGNDFNLYESDKRNVKTNGDIRTVRSSRYEYLRVKPALVYHVVRIYVKRFLFS